MELFNNLFYLLIFHRWSVVLDIHVNGHRTVHLKLPAWCEFLLNCLKPYKFLIKASPIVTQERVNY